MQIMEGINMHQSVQAATVPATPAPRRVLRLPEVITKTGLSRTTLYTMSKAGQFPESISLGGKAMGWIEAEIDAWIEERMAARQSAPVDATRSM